MKHRPPKGAPETVIVHGFPWTRPMAKEFKTAWLEAREQKKELFLFRGGPVLEAYAKYVVQYVESVFGPL